MTFEPRNENKDLFSLSLSHLLFVRTKRNRNQRLQKLLFFSTVTACILLIFGVAFDVRWRERFGVWFVGSVALSLARALQTNTTAHASTATIAAALAPSIDPVIAVRFCVCGLHIPRERR